MPSLFERVRQVLRWPGSNSSTEPNSGGNPMNDLSQRIQAAAESILSNEAISADLDDEAAQALITWGVDLAKQIAAGTLELDDRAADEVLYQPMRALRKLLRAVRQWALDPQAEHLQNLIEQLPVVFGEQSYLPGTEQITAMMQHSGDDPLHRIQQLRAWIEG